MHGSLFEARCLKCRSSMAWNGDMDATTACPLCAESGGMRPGVVWFGEQPLHMQAIECAIRSCDVFVAIGTSGTVYPAAGFAADAYRHGSRTIELNLDPNASSGHFSDSRPGPAGETVPQLVRELLDAR